MKHDFKARVDSFDFDTYWHLGGIVAPSNPDEGFWTHIAAGWSFC